MITKDRFRNVGDNELPTDALARLTNTFGWNNNSINNILERIPKLIYKFKYADKNVCQLKLLHRKPAFLIQYRSTINCKRISTFLFKRIVYGCFFILDLNTTSVSTRG